MKSRSKKQEPGSKKEEGGRFELRFHAGYKGEEIPRALVIGSREFAIEKVVSRQRVLDQKTGKCHEAFKCRMEGTLVIIKIYESGEWEISFPDKA